MIFDFNFNLRHYDEGRRIMWPHRYWREAVQIQKSAADKRAADQQLSADKRASDQLGKGHVKIAVAKMKSLSITVGRCRLTLLRPPALTLLAFNA